MSKPIAGKRLFQAYGERSAPLIDSTFIACAPDWARTAFLAGRGRQRRQQSVPLFRDTVTQKRSA